jgi:hypothetical protein
MKLNLPPYWDSEYLDTWRYTNERRYVNEDEWEEDAPAGYRDGVMAQTSAKLPDFWYPEYQGVDSDLAQI